MVRPPRRATNSEQRPDFREEASRRQIPLPTGDRSHPSLPRDVLNFLFEYPFADPAEEEDPCADLNARFYQDKQAARPRRAKCTELQDELRDNWDELEGRHDFVQWLFPIREQGLNWDAQPLQLHEIATIKSNPEAMARLLDSYRIMLAFYGLRLVDPTTGELELNDAEPAPSSGSYLKRFRNLERNMHNYLRITRILKCLGEFGLEQHPPSFLLFLLVLQAPASSTSFGGPHLDTPSLTRSYDNYWRWCVRDDGDRQFVVRKSHQVREEQADWTVEEYREWVKRRAEQRRRAGSNGAVDSPDVNRNGTNEAGKVTALPSDADADTDSDIEADLVVSAAPTSAEPTVSSSLDLPSPFKKAPSSSVPSSVNAAPPTAPERPANEVGPEAEDSQSSLPSQPPRKTFAQLELEADADEPPPQSQAQSDVEGPPPLAQSSAETEPPMEAEASASNDGAEEGGGGAGQGQDSLPSPFKKARISDEDQVDGAGP